VVFITSPKDVMFPRCLATRPDPYPRVRVGSGRHVHP